MKTSVIVPIYNVSKYLNKCIDSILSQTIDDIEIILVNDGSTDGSDLICNEYEKLDKRVFVIHQENKGLSVARNAGLEKMFETNGNDGYCAFIDSDDWVEPDFCEKQIKCLEETGADLCICLAKAEDEQGNFIGISPYTEIDRCINPHEMYELLVKKSLPKYITAWLKFYRKSILTNFRFPVGFHFEDESCHRIYQACNKIAFINKPLYHYLVRKGSLCHSVVSIYDCDAVELHLDRVKMLIEEDEVELAIITLDSLLDRLIYLSSRLSDTNSRTRIQKLLKEAKYEYDLLNFVPVSNKFKILFKIYAFNSLVKLRKIKSLI